MASAFLSDSSGFASASGNKLSAAGEDNLNHSETLKLKTLELV